MGYADPDKQREFARKWRSSRRQEWFDNNGPCRRCWSTEKLQVYYPDQSEKVEHRLWSWKKERRDEELKKCILLCSECWHLVKNYKYTSKRQHGTELMYDKGRCRCRACRDAHAESRRSYRRGKDIMSIAGTLEELYAFKDRTYREIDSLSKEIERKQSFILDIETTIRVLQSLPGKPITLPKSTNKPDPVPVPTHNQIEEESDDPDPEPDPESVQETKPSMDVAELVTADDEKIHTGQSKKCKKCGRIKPLDRANFAYSKRSSDGFIHTCNACNKRQPLYISSRKQQETSQYAGTTSVLGDSFYCSKCRTKFMTQAALDVHNETYHSRDPNPNQCPVATCKKRFETETDLENHIIHHHPKYARDYGYA